MLAGTELLLRLYGDSQEDVQLWRNGWPAAALRSSPLLGECLSGSLCAGERMQVVYHWPHWAGALRHHTLPVRRRLVLMLPLTGPTFAQRRKLQASAL